MELTIDKSHVYDEVIMNVSVIARSLKDANGDSLYDKVRIQERDEAVLDAYYSHAKGDLLLACKDFVKPATDYNVIALNEEPRMSQVFLNELKDLFHSFLVKRVTAQWFQIKAVEYAAIFMDSSEDVKRLIKEKLYYKDVPTITLYGEED